MPTIAYSSKRFSVEASALIEKANEIIEDMERQGFSLTLRQLYYKFVAGDHFPESWQDAETGSTNNERSYKKLGDIVNDARMCGLIDWEAIVDLTRQLRQLSTWENPSEIVTTCSTQFKLDLWSSQKHRPEVWVEKDAAVGIVAGICDRLRVPYFSCRGYTSQTAMWEASQRILSHIQGGQIPFIIHLGDHDPSGVDMSRDIEERLKNFLDYHVQDGDIEDGDFQFKRAALNMDQIKLYSPPPNPTKVTDSRSGPYIRRFGHECWELDALEPAVVAKLITDHVASVRDQKKWDALSKREEKDRSTLREVATKMRGGK